MKKHFLSLLFCFAGFCSFGQYGVLDPSFGNGGTVTTPFYFGGDVQKILVQPDGKIIAIGNADSITTAAKLFAIARYNADGSPDNTFGNNGSTEVHMGLFGNDNTFCSDGALQPDGKIIAAGHAYFANHIDFTLVRYNSDGSLDNTFGTGGIAHTNIGNSASQVNAIALQPDGKIIAGGNATSGFVFTVARYNANGTVDSSFGTDGIVQLPEYYTSCNTVLLQPDGKIVAAGAYNSGPNIFFTSARYNTNGTIDSTFGIAGRVTTNLLGMDNVAYDSALQPDGKIILAGYTNGDGEICHYFAMVRYNTNGTPDSSFGLNGLDTTFVLGGYEPFWDEAYSIALQSDGKILLGGTALIRYNSDGSLDTTFGAGGKLFSTLNPFSCLTMQPDGKILAGCRYDYTTARYLPDVLAGVVDFSEINYSLSVYPNPIVQNARLEYTLVKDENLSLQLFDISGRLVETFFTNQMRETGNHEEELKLNKSIVAGNYILTLSNGKQVMSVKIIKQ